MGTIMAYLGNLTWVVFLMLFANFSSQILQRIQSWSPAGLVPNLLIIHLLFTLSLLLVLVLSLVYALIAPTRMIDSIAPEYSYGSDEHKTVPLGLIMIMPIIFLVCYWFAS